MGLQILEEIRISNFLGFPISLVRGVVDKLGVPLALKRRVALDRTSPRTASMQCTFWILCVERNTYHTHTVSPHEAIEKAA